MLPTVYQIFILNAKLKAKSMKLSLLVIAAVGAQTAGEFEPAKDIAYGKFEYKLFFKSEPAKIGPLLS